MEVRNILADIPECLPDEAFETIAAGEKDGVRVERILSYAHASPPGYWYDQDRSEWVMVVQGSAGLLLEGEEEVTVMEPGDYVDIPAHKKHRVEWTDPDVKTVWLAVHY